MSYFLCSNIFELDLRICPGIIHIVDTQNVPKNYYFLPHDMHTNVCV